MSEPRAQDGDPADLGRSSKSQPTTQDIESFWTTGEDAVSADGRRAYRAPVPGCTCNLCTEKRAQASATDETGVDLPGVGHVRSVLSGREAEPGEFPDTLRGELEREERDRLLIRLVFVAKQTAELCETSDGFGFVRICRGCGLVRADGSHRASCPVGATLETLEKLQALSAPVEGGAR